jgi:hypothetical protein
MLINIQKSEKTLRAYTNGGHQDFTETADLPGFFKVWYNPLSMVNILSWADVRKRFCITADTNDGAFINVHLDDGRILRFQEIESGLYLFNNRTNKLKKPISGYSFLTLVKANKQAFTRREIAAADAAIDFHRKIGLPNYKKFFKLLEQGYYRNCPITADDAKRALHIYGTDILMLQGKTVRRKPSALTAIRHVDIPQTVTDRHPSVILSADYMFVNGIPILHTISQNYKFWTIEALPDKKKANKKDIKEGIIKVINLYHNRNLPVTQINPTTNSAASRRM